jgi:PAS domain S-box-containing protein
MKLQVTPNKSPPPSASQNEEAANAWLSDAQAENRALKAELERYRLAVRASREGLWEMNIATGDIWYSPQILVLLGWEGREANSPQGPIISPDAWIADIHPEDKGHVTEAIKAHIKHNAIFDLEYRFRRPSGEYRWLRTTGEAVRDETGFATHMLGAISDITERKLAEQSFRESQAESEAARSYLANALQSMRNGFGIWDADERLVISNEPFRLLAGKAADFYQVGVSFEDVIRQGAEVGQ